MDPSRFRSLEDILELREVLGEGGFGVVYRALPRGGGPEAAVKLSRRPPDPETLARVRREVRLLEGLAHPRLVRFLGCFEARDGSLALAYERVEGRTLAAHMAEAPVGVAQALGWCRDLAEGLDALHRAGLVHRDLKPANAMVEPGGRVKLLDFGLLRDEAAGATLTATGIVLGTPRYMAPEQIRGARPDRRSDLYSLAVVAYELLAGRAPFEGSSGEVIDAHLAGGAPPISRVAGHLPRAFDAVLDRALALAPEQRHGSGIELVLALETASAATGPARAGTRGPVNPRAGVGPRPAAEAAGATRLSKATPSSGRRGRRSGSFLLRLRTPVLVLSWALCLAAGLMLGRRAAIEGPGREPPSPPPAQGAGAVEAFDPEFPDRLVDELGRLDSLGIDATGRVVPRSQAAGAAIRELVGRDPADWGRILRAGTELSRWYDWLRAGGRPEELEPALAARLRDADRAFARQGLPQPGRPFLYLPRPGAPEPLPAGWTKLARVLPGGAVPGYAGLAVRRIEEARTEARARQEALLSLPAGADLPGGVGSRAGVALVGRREPLRGFIELVWASPEQRIAVVDWLEPGNRLLAEALYAAGRSIREEPETRAALALDLSRAVQELEPSLHGWLALVPPEALLGGTPRSSAGWHLAGELAESLERVLKGADRVADLPTGYVRTCFERAERPEAGAAGIEREPAHWSWLKRVELDLGAGRPGATDQAFNGLFDPGERPEGFRLHLALALGEAWARGGSGEPAGSERIPRLVEFLGKESAGADPGLARRATSLVRRLGAGLPDR